MSRAERVRRRASLGFGIRASVFVLWPFMHTSLHWDIQGAERLTEERGGVIVAPNHMSWLDPIVVSYALWEADRPPRFLAKESLFRAPVVGRVLSSAGQIPVYRQSADAASAIRDALRALERGEAVVVYPEGTMTRDPDLWPMTGKTGAVRLALASGRPLFPVAHWGIQEVMRPYAKELRLLPRKSVTVRVGEPVDLSDLRQTPATAATLAAGTLRLMAAITALLAEIRGEQPPAPGSAA